MTFFNSLVGGTKSASKHYETDYWATSYKEAIEWIKKDSGNKKVKVLVAANDYSITCASWYKSDNIDLYSTFKTNQTGDLLSEFDYYIGLKRYGFEQNFPDANIIAKIGINGAVFSVIKKQRLNSKQINF